MSTLLKFAPGDRVIYSQNYFVSIPSSVPNGAVGEVVRLADDKTSIVVDFDELGCVTVPANDLDWEPELTNFPIEVDYNVCSEELINTDKSTLVREKLLAQENDPDLDNDITLALLAKYNF